MTNSAHAEGEDVSRLTRSRPSRLTRIGRSLFLDGVHLVTFMFVAAVLVIVLASWRIAGLHVNEVGDLIGQGQLLFSAANSVTTIVLAGTTIIYTRHTKAMADEMRRTRLVDAEDRARAEGFRQANEMFGAVMALVGAGNDLVGSGAALARALRQRFSATARRLRRVYLTDAARSLAAAATALERIRYVSEEQQTDALATHLVDLLRSHLELALRGASTECIEGSAGAIGDAVRGLLAGLPGRASSERLVR